MAQTIEVRDADASDRIALIDFHRSLYQEHRGKVVAAEDLPLIEYRNYDQVLRDDLDALLRDRSGYVLLAESEGAALGYITGRVRTEPDRVLPRRGVIEDWFVVPEARGSGVGAKLLHALEKRFAATGCEVIESATWAGNTGARHAHDALGFREIRVMYRKRV
jgi:ribosomal protein S18 acetylase RimI-like enzyme